MLMLLSGCGEPRRFGDVDGVPVTINASIDRAFFKNMENRQGRPSAGVGAGFSSGGHSSVGVGVGLSFSSTQVFLVGGDAVGQKNVFRKEMKWGQNSFTVPLTPGRTLHLTAVAEGGRRGWEALGPVTIPLTAADKAPAVEVVLDENGAKITASEQPAPESTPPESAPPAPTPAPAE